MGGHETLLGRLSEDNTGNLLRRPEYEVNVHFLQIRGRTETVLGVEIEVFVERLGLEAVGNLRDNFTSAVLVHGDDLGEELRRNPDNGLNDEIDATSGVLAILTKKVQLNAASSLEGVESERENLRASVRSLDVGLDRLAVVVANVLSSTSLGDILDVELLDDATFFGVLLDEHLRDLGRESSEGQLEVEAVTSRSRSKVPIILLDAEAAVKRGVDPVRAERSSSVALSKEVEDDSSERAALLLHSSRRSRRIRIGLSSTPSSSSTLSSLFVGLISSIVCGGLSLVSASRHVSHRSVERSSRTSASVLLIGNVPADASNERSGSVIGAGRILIGRAASLVSSRAGERLHGRLGLVHGGGGRGELLLTFLDTSGVSSHGRVVRVGGASHINRI